MFRCRRPFAFRGLALAARALVATGLLAAIVAGGLPAHGDHDAGMRHIEAAHDAHDGGLLAVSDSHTTRDLSASVLPAQPVAFHAGGVEHAVAANDAPVSLVPHPPPRSPSARAPPSSV
ncbi:MAG: hypothetical protein WD934_04685 [Gemmatimonadales bacterium]